MARLTDAGAIVAGPVRAWARPFFEGRRVLVTGHTGFKGAWLVALLGRLGARVSGLSLAPETPSLFALAGIEARCAGTLGDVRDPAVTSAVLAAHAPEIVLHLAAQSLVLRSYREPVETFATNVMGTVNVLEAARRAPSVRAVVVVTSDKCYENDGAGRPFREGDPLGGHDPYSASKAAAELVTASYRRSFQAGGPAIASARAGNVLGGGDFAADRLVPEIVRATVRGEPVRLRNPGATRPWQHVLDPLAGYLALARALVVAPEVASAAWNFGPEGDPAPVGEVARRFVLRLGGAGVELGDGPTPHEAPALRLDPSAARERLGVRTRLDLDATLDLTAAWYRAWMDHPDAAGRVLDEQIDRYLDLGGAADAAPVGDDARP